MTWHCQACTYININDRAIRCHSCSTHRPNSYSAAPTIVDLTELCSPKVKPNENQKSSRRRGGGDIMESNRSRRRRRLEKSTTICDIGVNYPCHNSIATDTYSTAKPLQALASKNISINENGTDINDDEIVVNPVPRRNLPPNVDFSGNYTRDVGDDSNQEESKLKKTTVTDKYKSDRKVERDKRSTNSSNCMKRKQPSPEQNLTHQRLTEIYNPLKPNSVESLLQRANIILQQSFKHKSLRPLQETAIINTLQRKSSIVVMATGGGKSLCYQLPALVGGTTSTNIRADTSRVTIVVCPLIALMMDQVNNLLKRGINTAACLSSTHSAKTRQEILNRLQLDKKKAQKGVDKNHTTLKPTPIQLLYCTPELIETDKFRAILTDLYELNRLYMFAIDEAHCLSTWGHDFRPAFRKLAWVRDAFPDIPIVACTGTATAKVIQDIRETLKMEAMAPCVMGSFNRHNISYEVRFKDSLNAAKAQGAILNLVSVVKEKHDIANKSNQPCSGIVYVHKREDCQSLALILSKATGMTCLAYHAGLKDSEREETQRQWTDGTCSVAVATVAFGMGIDLPHVRYVIHWTLAKSLEGFYQESGRAGRDGRPSCSILYYSKDDASKLSFLVKLNAERVAKHRGKMDSSYYQQQDHSLVELEGMVNYCIKPMCKRKYVLGHFGENIDSNTCNKTCDFCLDPAKVERDIQASECMSTIINSHRLIRAGRKDHHFEEKKFHLNPLDDGECTVDDDGSYDDFLGCNEDFLGVIDNPGQKESASEPAQKMQGFAKASSMLSKYAKMECHEVKKGGFVNFKTRTFDNSMQEDIDGKKYRAVSIPNHLRVGLPDPLAAHNTTKSRNDESLSGTTSSYVAESERLKAELEELQKQKAAALAKMGGSLKGLTSRKVLQTPSLSFKKQR